MRLYHPRICSCPCAMIYSFWDTDTLYRPGKSNGSRLSTSQVCKTAENQVAWSLMYWTPYNQLLMCKVMKICIDILIYKYELPINHSYRYKLGARVLFQCFQSPAITKSYCESNTRVNEHCSSGKATFRSLGLKHQRDISSQLSKACAHLANYTRNLRPKSELANYK